MHTLFSYEAIIEPSGHYQNTHTHFSAARLSCSPKTIQKKTPRTCFQVHINWCHEIVPYKENSVWEYPLHSLIQSPNIKNKGEKVEKRENKNGHEEKQFFVHCWPAFKLQVTRNYGAIRKRWFQSSSLDKWRKASSHLAAVKGGELRLWAATTTTTCFGIIFSVYTQILAVLWLVCSFTNSNF